MAPAPEEQRAGPWDHAVLAVPNELSVLKHRSLPVVAGRQAKGGGPAFTDCLPSWLSWPWAVCASSVLLTFCDPSPKSKSLKRFCHQVLRSEILAGDSWAPGVLSGGC